MSEKDVKLVTLRTKGNKEDLNAEPEMIELRGMVQSGQLDRNRTVSYLNAEAEANDKGDPRPSARRGGAFPDSITFGIIRDRGDATKFKLSGKDGHGPDKQEGSLGNASSGEYHAEANGRAFWSHRGRNQ